MSGRGRRAWAARRARTRRCIPASPAFSGCFKSRPFSARSSGDRSRSPEASLPGALIQFALQPLEGPRDDLGDQVPAFGADRQLESLSDLGAAPGRAGVGLVRLDFDGCRGWPNDLGLRHNLFASCQKILRCQTFAPPLRPKPLRSTRARKPQPESRSAHPQNSGRSPF